MSKYSHQYSIASKSNPSTRYTVSLTHSGEWECSCPHWINRRAVCKHIQEAQRCHRMAPNPCPQEEPALPEAPASRTPLLGQRVTIAGNVAAGGYTLPRPIEEALVIMGADVLPQGDKTATLCLAGKNARTGKLSVPILTVADLLAMIEACPDLHEELKAPGAAPAAEPPALVAKGAAKSAPSHPAFAGLVLPPSSDPRIPRNVPEILWPKGLAEDLALLTPRPGKNIVLRGPSGTGKSTAILRMAQETNRILYRVNFNEQVSPYELVGSKGAKDGSTFWEDGILTKAMRLGHWILLDEWDLMEPALATIFYPVLEERPTLCLMDNGGEIVEAAEGFAIFATANAFGNDEAGQYVGTKPISPALRSRCVVLDVDYPTVDAESTILMHLGRKALTAKLAAEAAKNLRAQAATGASSMVWTVRQTQLLAEFAEETGSWEHAYRLAATGQASREEVAAGWKVVKPVTGTALKAA